MKMFLLITALLVLASCSVKRPVLYPNAHLQKVGQAQAQQDIEDCCRRADAYIKSEPGKKIAKETKTEGISINQSPVGNQSPIRVNIWDFGGQEIMHATHQFFLTKRSVYLLVLDARLTQEENRVEYWLKIIQSFGGESPVLIIGNKTDQHPLDIDRTGLQKKYPNIVGILDTSAATGAGIAALETEIAKQVDTLPHVRDFLPKTWFAIKSKLETLGRVKNFITRDEYLGLCATNEVTDETSQHTLIGFLHDLGVVLHFQDDPRLEALGKEKKIINNSFL